MDCRQFPKRWDDLLLLEGKGAALPQSAQYASAKCDVVEEVSTNAADPVLLVVGASTTGCMAGSKSTYR
jgi:hypothetical protein